MGSKSYNLNQDELFSWLKKTVLYSVILPGLVVFITSLQGGADWKVAFGAFSATIMGSVLNITNKYIADNR